MNSAIVVRAQRNSPLVRIIVNGEWAAIEDLHPDLEFEVYLDGVLIGSGVGRDELDRALGGLKEIMDDGSLAELASAILELYAEGKRTELIATSAKEKLMLGEIEDCDLRGPGVLRYAEDFLLERQRAHGK